MFLKGYTIKTLDVFILIKNDYYCYKDYYKKMLSRGINYNYYEAFFI